MTFSNLRVLTLSSSALVTSLGLTGPALAQEAALPAAPPSESGEQPAQAATD